MKTELFQRHEKPQPGSGLLWVGFCLFREGFREPLTGDTGPALPLLYSSAGHLRQCCAHGADAGQHIRVPYLLSGLRTRSSSSTSTLSPQVSFLCTIVHPKKQISLITSRDESLNHTHALQSVWQTLREAHPTSPVLTASTHLSRLQAGAAGEADPAPGCNSRPGFLNHLGAWLRTGMRRFFPENHEKSNEGLRARFPKKEHAFLPLPFSSLALPSFLEALPQPAQVPSDQEGSSSQGWQG